MLSSLKFVIPEEVGLHRIIDESNSPLKVLGLHALRLNAGKSETIQFDDRESGIFFVSGKAQLNLSNISEMLCHNDFAYAPVRQSFTIHSKSDDTLVIIPTARTSTAKQVFVRKYKDVVSEENRNEIHGALSFSRSILVYGGMDNEMARMAVGVTSGQDGSWTSWPPHEHGETFEEIYYYFDMTPEGFAVHVILTGNENESAYIIRNNYAIAIPHSYHPLVASPGNKLHYLFVMGSKDEEKNSPSTYRQAAQVHPDFRKHDIQV
jgi:5-deoxy-glucuronate isomerase